MFLLVKRFFYSKEMPFWIFLKYVQLCVHTCSSTCTVLFLTLDTNLPYCTVYTRNRKMRSNGHYQRAKWLLYAKKFVFQIKIHVGEMQAKS